MAKRIGRIENLMKGCRAGRTFDHFLQQKTLKHGGSHCGRRSQRCHRKGESNLSLGREDDGATSLAELLLSLLGHPTGLDDARDLDVTVTEELGEALGEEVDNGELAALLGLGSGLSSDHGGQVVEVDGGLPVGVALVVEVAHADLTEVTGMVLVEVDTMVVLATGVTATGGMLTVLTDATVTTESGTTLVTDLLETGRHMD
jgi:hypothetical protein